MQKWFLKYVNRRIKPSLAAYGFLKTVKIKPAVVWEPGQGKVMVLAPHMDDEVIGCGGALYQHTLRGAEVTVVYLTDGSLGSKKQLNLKGEELRKSQQMLTEIRKEEARQALRILNIKDLHFLDVAELALAATPEVVNRLRQILVEIQPDMVYLPFFLEEHPDHRATSDVFLASIEATGFNPDVYGYEVWTPLVPNCLVVIDDVLEFKRQALGQYRSQLEDKDYIHTSLGLNAYRASSLLDRSGYVEAFFTASAREYSRLYGSFSQSYPAKSGRIT